MFEAFIIDELLKQERRRDELERDRLRPRLELPVPPAAEFLDAPERAPAAEPEAAETGQMIVIDLG